MNVHSSIRAGVDDTVDPASDAKLVLDTMLQGVVYQDAAGTILSMNPAAERILGKSREELLGQTSVSVQHHTLREDGTPFPGHDHPAMIALRTGREVHDVLMGVFNPRAEDYRWIRITAVPLFDAGAARPTRVYTLFEDVTERRAAERGLRDRESWYRNLVEASPDPIFVNRGGKVVLANHACARLFGSDDPSAIVGKTPFELFHPEYHDVIRERIAEVRATGRVAPLEERILRADGEVRDVEAIGAAFPDGDDIAVQVILRDITDRKRAEQALRDADRRKDEFLGMLSHELRNPLTPLRNAAFILRHAAPESDEARRARDIVERQTDHLARLVDDLLDVTRISRGKIELRRSRTDLADVVRTVTDDYRGALQANGVALRTEIGGGVWADVDATRITQAVDNLLHNASKFTRPGDEISVSLQSSGTDVRLTVRDTGAGIDPALLPEIFDAFVQGDRTLARTHGGLGLGLALVRAIAELHGGAVRASSAGRGHGAEFVLRLPSLPPADRPSRPRDAWTAPQGPHRVLVVDDNVDGADSLADVVRMLGHSVEVAYDGPAAVARARTNPPSIVLCDLGLPGMTGYEVAQALRALEPVRIALYAVSGYARPDDVRRATAAGFDGHLAKPCDPEAIRRVLDEAPR